MRKRLTTLAGVLALSITAAACGGSKDASSTSGASSATTAKSGSDTSATSEAGAATTAGDAMAKKDDRTFIYITNDPIGINKFLELGKIGTEAAAEKFGGEAKIYESTDEQSQRSNIEAAIDEKPDVIVLITFDFEDLAKEYAEKAPDQKFLLIDSCPQDAPSNLTCAVFREQEASYLLGVEAGMLTKSNKIGSVVAVDIPFLHRYSDSFALGAKSVNENTADTQVFIGGDNPFADPATAKEQALSLTAQQIDHIFAVGAGSNGGIFEAATEGNAFAYGVDVNQCPEAPGHVVDNTMKAVDVLVVNEIGKILDGKAEGLSSYGLAEKGMDITSQMEGAKDSKCVVMDHPEVVEKVKQIKQSIIDGDLKIPDPMQG